MRPHRLELTAIGSYAGHVVVDFDALSPFGLFHIHGPTGAGKSSLLAGMCFALYGTVPSPRRADGLRSHHAETTTEAVAALEFSTQEADWRIVRTPTQVRGKLRGSGTTEQRTTATLLRRVDGDWQPVTSGVKEVDAIVHRLVGLDAEQFMQVVVLPQGGFQRALRAGADERAALLSTLFHTERFGLYSAQLKDRADEATKRRDLQGVRARGVIAQVRTRATTLGLEVSSLADEPTLDQGEAEALGAVAAEARHRADLVLGNLREAEHARTSAQQALTNATLRHDQHRRRAGALVQRSRLDIEQPDIERAITELQQAEQVAPYIMLVDRLSDDQRQLEQTGSEVATSRTRINQMMEELAAVIDLTESSASLLRTDHAMSTDDLDRTRRMARSLAERAGAVQQKQAQVVRRQAELGHHEQRADQAEDAQRRATTLVTQQHRHIEQLRNAIVESQRSAERCEVLRHQLDTLRAQLDAANELTSLDDEIRTAQRSFLAAEERSINAQHHHLDLVRLRIEGMAAELAGRLVDGEACAVCGSAEHPDPAQPAITTVSADDVEVARRTADRVQAAAQRHRHRVGELEHRAAALRSVANGAADDVDRARRDHDAAAKALQEAREEADELEPNRLALRKAEGELPQHEQRVAEHRDLAAAERAAADATRSQIDELVTDIRASFDEHADPGAIKATTDDVLRLLDQLHGATERERSLRTQVASEQRRIDEALRSIGLDDVDRLRSLARSDDERAALRDRIDRANELRSTIEATLDELRHLTDEAPPELGPIQEQAASTASRYDELAAIAATAQHEASEITKLTMTYTTEMKTLAPLQVEAERLRRLAELCNGTKINDRRMSLERYVLAAYLEEVAAAASKRLRVMTSGRYTLRHSDARVRGNAASGLSLLVGDAHTGIEREVSTLSGGETFLASLALALGLSDVVQQHAGGVHIDALFVDEGFGSLDPGTLDLAMAELDRLREGGRLIGVISHVAALRERIPVGIEVVPGPNGSTLTQTATLIPVANLS